MWRTVHFVALGFDEDHRDAYVAFYRSLVHAIPCSACSTHYAEMLKLDPVEQHVQDADALFAWTVEIHNAVNERLGKPTWTVDQAKEFYKNLLLPEDPRVAQRRRLTRDLLVWLAALAVVAALTGFAWHFWGKSRPSLAAAARKKT